MEKLGLLLFDIGLFASYMIAAIIILMLIQLVVYQGSGKRINLYKKINKIIDKMLEM